MIESPNNMKQSQTKSNNANNHALPGITQVMTLYVLGNPELHSTWAKFGGIPTWRTSSAMSVVSFRHPAQDKHQGNCTSDNWEGSKCYGISCRIKPFALRVSRPLLIVTVQTTLKNSNALHPILCTEHRWYAKLLPKRQLMKPCR